MHMKLRHCAVRRRELGAWRKRLQHLDRLSRKPAGILAAAAQPRKPRQPTEIVAGLKEIASPPPQLEGRLAGLERAFHLINEAVFAAQRLEETGSRVDLTSRRMIQGRPVMGRRLAMRPECRCLAGRLARIETSRRIIACSCGVVDEPCYGPVLLIALVESPEH